MRFVAQYGRGLLLLLLPVWIGCAHQPETPRPFSYHPDVTADVYYPLESGNAWTYDVVAYDFDGSVDGQDVLITQVVRHDGEIVTVESAGIPIQYRVNAQGIFKHPSETPLIRHPIVAKAEWPIHVQDIRGVGRVESVDATIDISGNVFEHCLIVVEEFPDEGIRIRYEYAPHVGLVRMEELFLVDGESYPHLQATLRIYKVGANRR